MTLESNNVPVSKPETPRLCPNCGTSLTLCSELGNYWFYHCDNCSFSIDDVLAVDQDSEEAFSDCVLAPDDPEYEYVKYISGLDMY